jgi:hypothetical protein
MEFIEAPLFSKLIKEYMDDEEYVALQWYLLQNPEGYLIPKSASLKEHSWLNQGKGKGVAL